jgi:uncharacterized RDD family membrane protein YckC
MNFAGFWIRFGAHLIDFILLNAVEIALEYGISLPLGLSAVSQQVVGVILSLALCYVYYVEIPMRRKTTIGKQIFGIYVLDAHTGEIFSRKQAVIRMFSYLLSYAIVGCGFLMAAFHPQKRALHDLIAGTVCVRLTKAEVQPELTLISDALGPDSEKSSKETIEEAKEKTNDEA